MDVGAAWQVRGIDLHDRADHHERPTGLLSGDRVEQCKVDAFVDDAEETELRAGDVALVFGFDIAGPRLCKVRDVDG
ncbi:hypothetical protein NHF48_009515 [Sphingomonas sp. H160509]|uniref:hypothetical protein n=1 Tax=Sphingomonas sp. H160509 TaxID=2955313 RepID=UPI0020984C83|nr:hypothetical protein [Sphingomonas sp. H160509]MDD1451162.1 hypothetical protein [Sphingomonas sp. H160509]